MFKFAFEHLSKSFRGPAGSRVEALRDFTLSSRGNELLVLLGASGSGKTTALRVLAGLEAPDSGELLLNGKPDSMVPARDRNCAMVFQHPALYPHLSVEGNLRLGLEIRRVPREQTRRRIGEAMELLGITELASRPPATLSGGQMQRVALARAVARQPGMLLLDEPLANLDGPSRAGLKETIRQVQAATGITMVLVTHDQAEAFSLAHRIAVMEAGSVLQVAPAGELYFKPESLAVAGFLSRPRLNVLPGVLLAELREAWFVVKCASGAMEPRLRLPDLRPAILAEYAGKPVLLAFRPEHIECFQAPHKPLTGSIGVQAKVERVESLGGWLDLHFNLAGHQLIARTVQRGATDGAPWEIALDLSAALLFDPATGRRFG